MENLSSGCLRVIELTVNVAPESAPRSDQHFVHILVVLEQDTDVITKADKPRSDTHCTVIRGLFFAKLTTKIPDSGQVNQSSRSCAWSFSWYGSFAK